MWCCNSCFITLGWWFLWFRVNIHWYWVLVIKFLSNSYMRKHFSLFQSCSPNSWYHGNPDYYSTMLFVCTPPRRKWKLGTLTTIVQQWYLAAKTNLFVKDANSDYYCTKLFGCEDQYFYERKKWCRIRHITSVKDRFRITQFIPLELWWSGILREVDFCHSGKFHCKGIQII